MRMNTFVAASDLHGDRQDGTAVAAFKRFVTDFKPRQRFFLGDIFDFRSLRGGANEEEKRHSMRADFHAGMDFLDWFRPSVITLGNHDQRLWDAVKKDGLARGGPIADYAAELIERFEKATTRMKAKILPYDKRKGVYRVGGLSFTHGFSAGSKAATEMGKVYGNVLFGHGHAIDVATVPGVQPQTARMIGCLCQLDLAYNRSHLGTLRQQHGWAYGVFTPSRNEVFQASVQDGEVVYAACLKTMKA